MFTFNNPRSQFLFNECVQEIKAGKRPVLLNDDKVPTLPGFNDFSKPYLESEKAIYDEICRLESKGIKAEIVARVTHGTELALDMDDPAIWDAFVDATDPDIIQKITMIQSPKRKTPHLHWITAGAMPTKEELNDNRGNLAIVGYDDAINVNGKPYRKPKIGIELKWNGRLITVARWDEKTQSNSMVVKFGDRFNLTTLTHDETWVLLKGAMSLDRRSDEQKRIAERAKNYNSTPNTDDGDSPEDEWVRYIAANFNKKQDLATFLPKYGYKVKGKHFVRPGKGDGISGVIDGEKIICFSSSDPLSEVGKEGDGCIVASAFAACALYDHNFNVRSAADAIAAENGLLTFDQYHGNPSGLGLKPHQTASNASGKPTPAKTTKSDLPPLGTVISEPEEKDEITVNIDHLNLSPSFVDMWNDLTEFRTGRSNAGMLQALIFCSTALGRQATFEAAPGSFYRADLRLIDIAATGSNKSGPMQSFVDFVPEFDVVCKDAGTSTAQAFLYEHGYLVGKAAKAKLVSDDKDVEDAEQAQREQLAIEKGKRTPPVLFYADDAFGFVEQMTGFKKDNDIDSSQFCKILDDNIPVHYSTAGKGKVFLPVSPRNFYLNLTPNYNQLLIDRKMQDAGAVFRLLPFHGNGVNLINSAKTKPGAARRLMTKFRDYVINNKSLLFTVTLPYDPVSNNGRNPGVPKIGPEKQIQLEGEKVFPDMAEFWNNNVDIFEKARSKMIIQAKKIAMIMALCDWVQNANDEVIVEMGKPIQRVNIDATPYYKSAYALVLLLQGTAVREALSNNDDSMDLDKMRKRVLKVYGCAMAAKTEAERSKFMKQLTESRLSHDIHFSGCKAWQDRLQRFDQILNKLVKNLELLKKEYDGIACYVPTKMMITPKNNFK